MMELNDTQYLNVYQLIEVFIRLDISRGKKIKYEDLNGYVDKASKISGIKLDNETFNQLLSDMEYQFKVKHTSGCKIYDDYDDPHNWYNIDDIQDKYFWKGIKNI